VLVGADFGQHRVLGVLAIYWRTVRSQLPTHLLRTIEVVSGLAGVAIESAQREEELRMLNNTLLRAEATARMGRWALDLQGGRLRWSPQMWDLLDLPPRPEALGAEEVEKLLHPEDRPRLRQAYARMLEGVPGEAFSVRRLLPDGSVRYLLQPPHVPVHDAQGRLCGYEGSVIDVTASKLGEEQLRRQLDELRRWQQVTLGREGRVCELKREVNALRLRLGEAVRYASVSDTEAQP